MVEFSPPNAFKCFVLYDIICINDFRGMGREAQPASM